jgi:multidrug efflux pump
VFGGMLSGTLLAVFFVPAFFVFVIGTQERFSAWRAQRGGAALTQENP